MLPEQPVQYGLGEPHEGRVMAKLLPWYPIQQTISFGCRGSWTLLQETVSQLKSSVMKRLLGIPWIPGTAQAVEIRVMHQLKKNTPVSINKLSTCVMAALAMFAKTTRNGLMASERAIHETIRPWVDDGCYRRTT